MKSLKFVALALVLAIASPAAAAPDPDLARAQSLQAAGDYDRAADIYDAVLARDPSNLAALLGGAQTSLEFELFDQALAYADAALRVAPNSADAFAARGLAYAGLKQNDKARADLERALAQGPHAKALEGRAWLWSAAGDHERAVEDFRAAYRADPKRVDPLVSVSYQLFELGRPGEAMAAVDEALKAAPDSDYALATRGRLLSAQGEFAAAVSVYQTLARRLPKDASVQVWLARALYDDGRSDKALETFEKAARLNPKSRDAWWGLAELLNEQGKSKLALQAYDRAVQIDPVNATLLTDRGVVRDDAGDSAGARADIDAALKVEPKSAYALNGRGRLDLSAENYEAAVRSFDAAVQSEPDYAPALANRAMAHQELGRYDRALKDINQAVLLIPNMPRFLAIKGDIYQQMEDHLQAVEAFDASIKGDPTAAFVWWARGESKAELGDLKGAEFDRAQALKLDPKVAG